MDESIGNQFPFCALVDDDDDSHLQAGFSHPRKVQGYVIIRLPTILS